MVRAWLIICSLLALSFMAASERVGVVVQYDAGSVATDCVSFSGDATAYDVLQSSRFSATTADFPPYGPGLCAIDATGCPASNCFCSSSDYWGFYYLSGGGWQYSSVGIGYLDDGGHRIVGDGGVIGFRWGGFGEMPALKAFDDICPRAQAAAGPSDERIRGLVLTLGNGSAGETLVETRDDEGRIIPFAEVHATRRVPVFGLEKAGFAVTDGEGRGALRLGCGLLFIEALSPMYLPARKELYVPCEAAAPQAAQEPAPPEKEEVGMHAVAVSLKKFFDNGATGWAETGWIGRRPR